MRLPFALIDVLDKVADGAGINKREASYLLGFDEHSIEASLIRAVANDVSRERFGNCGVVQGQIGVEIMPCPANCGFCVFGAKYKMFEPYVMPEEEILEKALAFSETGRLSSLFIMTMHQFGFDRLVKTIEMLRHHILPEIEIVVNIGDFDRKQGEELKAVGVNGAYHVLRLREGIDTNLDPEKRVKTLGVIKDVGLDLHYCCEPLGPEHSNEEIVEQMFRGIEYECAEHAAMKRVWVEQLPLARFGQITELRLAQVVAVVTLASVNNPALKHIAVHEPNKIGLTSGANTVYAESGSNPRDCDAETETCRGRTVDDCVEMLFDSGFSSLLYGNGCVGSLTHEVCQHLQI
ncbi:hypothetical protein JD969_20275 [Planctomycetota bacterium]|nr:hypothetical protein JD969_20275 [Planctomycetota bacterium]